MKERILAFMEDMHTLDAVRVGAWFADNATLWIPPAEPIAGGNRINALFRCMFKRYESLHWEILDIVPVNDNRCIHVCRSHGKIKDREKYTNYVMTDITFNDEGKITSLSDYFKDTSLFL